MRLPWNLWRTLGAIPCLWTEEVFLRTKEALNTESQRRIFLPKGLVS